MDELLKIFPLGGGDPCGHWGRGMASGDDDGNGNGAGSWGSVSGIGFTSGGGTGSGLRACGGFQKGDGEGDGHVPFIPDPRSNGGGSVRGGCFQVASDGRSLFFQG